MKAFTDWIKKIGILGVFAIIILITAYLYELQSQKVINIQIGTKNENTVYKYYTVNKVIDGDTLSITMDGVSEKIRLIGINTPETVDPRTPVQCFGKEASSRMKDLAEDNLIRLEYDDTQGTRDVYNRILAYVYLEDGQMLNRKMIAEGYAYEYTYLTPYKYQKEFRELQTLARTSARGLWSSNTCHGSKLFN